MLALRRGVSKTLREAIDVLRRDSGYEGYRRLPSSSYV